MSPSRPRWVLHSDIFSLKFTIYRQIPLNYIFIITLFTRAIGCTQQSNVIIKLDWIQTERKKWRKAGARSSSKHTVSFERLETFRLGKTATASHLAHQSARCTSKAQSGGRRLHFGNRADLLFCTCVSARIAWLNREEKKSIGKPVHYGIATIRVHHHVGTGHQPEFDEGFAGIQSRTVRKIWCSSLGWASSCAEVAIIRRNFIVENRGEISEWLTCCCLRSLYMVQR